MRFDSISVQCWCQAWRLLSVERQSSGLAWVPKSRDKSTLRGIFMEWAYVCSGWFRGETPALVWGGVSQHRLTTGVNRLFSGVMTDVLLLYWKSGSHCIERTDIVESIWNFADAFSCAFFCVLVLFLSEERPLLLPVMDLMEYDDTGWHLLRHSVDK